MTEHPRPDQRSIRMHPALGEDPREARRIEFFRVVHGAAEMHPVAMSMDESLVECIEHVWRLVGVDFSLETGATEEYECVRCGEPRLSRPSH